MTPANPRWDSVHLWSLLRLWFYQRLRRVHEMGPDSRHYQRIYKWSLITCSTWARPAWELAQLSATRNVNKRIWHFASIHDVAANINLRKQQGLRKFPNVAISTFFRWQVDIVARHKPDTKTLVQSWQIPSGTPVIVMQLKSINM